MPRRRRRNTARDVLAAYARLFAVCLALAMLIIPETRGPLMFVAVGAGGVYVGVRIHRKHRQVEARRLWAIRAQTSDGYLAMSPGEFEHALAYLCERDGCRGVKVVGGAGDLGADVVATLPNGTRLVVQAKRYAPGNLVTSPHLQRFGGTCYAVHQADVAVVVTTSRFTQQAQSYAGRMRIRLFSAQELGAWASGTGPPPWL